MSGARNTHGDGGDGQEAVPAAKRGRDAPVILALGMLAAIGPMSIDMYLPSFPAIAGDFGTDLSRVGYSLSSYFVGISLGQLVYGPLMDRYGRRVPLVAGLVLYTLAAIGCGLAPNLGVLVAMRFLLALGGCAGMVGSRAVVRDLFPVNEAARVFSLVMLVMGVAPMVAPGIGGAVVSFSGWRTVFAILAGFGLVLILVSRLFLPGDVHREARSGAWSFAGTMRDFASVGRSPAFLPLALAGGFSGSGLFAYISGASALFMRHYGYSKVGFGIAFGLNAAFLILGSQVNRLLLRSRPIARLTFVAAAAQAVAGLALGIAAVLGLLGPVSTTLLIMAFLFCHGFLNPNTTAMALAPFGSKAGSAAALFGSIQMAMATVSSILISAVAGAGPLSMALVMAVCALSGFGFIIAGTKLRPAPQP